MLGKRPCLLRTTSSCSLLVPLDETEGEAATFSSCAQVTEKNPGPALSAPCKIVIGFDIGAEKKPPDVCESPRSVLDTLALLPSQEKQRVVARSHRSALGSLLTANSGSGVGLEVVTNIRDKEVDEHVGSVAASLKASFPLQYGACPDKASLSLKSIYCHSKGTGGLDNASNSDFMDADNPSCQRKVPSGLYMEDERLDADISPQRCRVMFAPLSQSVNASITDMNISPCQSRALDACPTNILKDDNSFPLCRQAPWHLGVSNGTPGNSTSTEHIKAQVSTLQSGESYCPGNEDSADGCASDHILTWHNETGSPCEDERLMSWQRQALHQVILNMGSEENSIQRSLFSAASPPSCPHSLPTLPSCFLKECAFCGHSLRLGKDIFMYRGDQAFCSAECRYQKIILDERKEKQGS